MKNGLFSLLFILIFLLADQKSANAQYILKAADEQYELFNYDKAIDLYEQAYKKNATLYTAERLAACHTFARHYKESESWYAIAVHMPDGHIENLLNYAKALQNNSKYSEAKAAYLEYAKLNKAVTPQQEKLWTMSCDSAVLWMNTPEPYIIKNEKKLNGLQSDWGAVIYNDKIIYTSDRGYHQENAQHTTHPFLKFDGAKMPDKHVYGWTGNNYQHLYSYDKGTDSITLFPLNAGTEYHVGAASFTADGNEIYYTLTRISTNLKYANGKIATINTEIFSSKRDKTSGKWSASQPFKYNNANEWSNADPFISADGRKLYFASTMPGGKGGSDLYVCLKTDAGKWARPVNLSTVNTPGNERSPYADNNNDFYFSSDGYIGMGGLDIFKSAYKDGMFGTPQNLRYPINSPRDDFSFIKSSVTTGYLASDRTEGLGDDDIYSFSKQKKVIELKLIGTVYAKNTHTPLAKAIVSLSKNDGLLVVETDTTGAFKFNLEEASDYSLTGEKTNFRSDGVALTTKDKDISTIIQHDLYLEPVEINKEIRLENIYYDFDKWEIRKDAAIELDKLVKIMLDNPTIWIELGSHTDSRGNDDYNMTLSQKRAEAAVKYIISTGINRNRITAVGYGETRLLNHCTNGVKCTKEEHQLNRRTEFKIVKQ